MSERNPSADKAEVLAEIGYALTYNPSEHLTIEGIAEVVRGAVYNSRDDGGDGDDLAAIVRLGSGRYAALEGWADYTGWDCQSGLEVSLHDTAEDAWLHGIGTDSRALIERAET